MTSRSQKSGQIQAHRNGDAASARPAVAVAPRRGADAGFEGLPRERAKKSFLAAMSHELRTPLNAIIGFAEIIDAEVFGPLPVPQYRAYIRDILGSAAHLLHIIEDVLEISRAEAGELVLNKREVDVASLIDQSLRTVRRQSQAKEIEIVADTPEDVIIQVDPAKLSRALAALLSNAIKFSAAGSTVRVAARLRDRDTVSVVVEDCGIGMDPRTVERAFAPFVQLDNRLSREFDGPGLGLPLARLLTELHGGRIGVDSKRGRGTTATITLQAYRGESGGPLHCAAGAGDQGRTRSL